VGKKHPKLFKHKNILLSLPNTSWPPTANGACPMAMACAATVIAFIPEAQPIATPKHSTVLGIFASNAACRTVLEPQPGKIAMEFEFEFAPVQWEITSSKGPNFHCYVGLPERN